MGLRGVHVCTRRLHRSLLGWVQHPVGTLMKVSVQLYCAYYAASLRTENWESFALRLLLIHRYFRPGPDIQGPTQTPPARHILVRKRQHKWCSFRSKGEK
eukprot:6934-Eustigmatos_ZCMA.PRE.1